jgi:hypothetical protein
VFAVLGSHPVLAKALGIAATLGTAWLAGRLALIWAERHDIAILVSVLVGLAAQGLAALAPKPD